MKKATALDVLRIARDLFVKEARAHSKAASSRTSDGTITYRLEEAHALSITGAIMLACQRADLPWQDPTVRRAAAMEAVTKARDSIGLAKTGDPYHDLANWNDAEETTRDRVVIVLSRALGMKPKPPRPTANECPRCGVAPCAEHRDPAYSIAIGAGPKTEGEIGTVAARIAAHDNPKDEVASFAPPLPELPEFPEVEAPALPSLPDLPDLPDLPEV